MKEHGLQKQYDPYPEGTYFWVKHEADEGDDENIGWNAPYWLARCMHAYLLACKRP